MFCIKHSIVFFCILTFTSCVFINKHLLNNSAFHVLLPWEEILRSLTRFHVLILAQYKHTKIHKCLCTVCDLVKLRIKFAVPAPRSRRVNTEQRRSLISKQWRQFLWLMLMCFFFFLGWWKLPRSTMTWVTSPSVKQRGSWSVSLRNSPQRNTLSTERVYMCCTQKPELMWYLYISVTSMSNFTLNSIFVSSCLVYFHEWLMNCIFLASRNTCHSVGG